MENNIEIAPYSFKADVWAHFGFYNIYGKKEIDKKLMPYVSFVKLK